MGNMITDAFFSNRRKETIKKHGSPTYVWATGIIAAGAIEYCSVAAMFPAARKYEPLDTVEIINNSAQPIRLWFNGQAINYLIPAGTIREISGRASWNLTAENVGLGNTAAGEVELNLSRAAYSEDQKVRGFKF